jgi:hypothetical protein
VPNRNGGCGGGRNQAVVVVCQYAKHAHIQVDERNNLRHRRKSASLLVVRVMNHRVNRSTAQGVVIVPGGIDPYAYTQLEYANVSTGLGGKPALP